MNDNVNPYTGAVEAPLNLGKFAAGAGGDDGSEPQAGEGQTLFIKKTAAQSSEQRPDSGRKGDDEFGLPIKDMLGLISYCYVRGVFSSKEIAERLKREPELRKQFGRHLPDEQTIKVFRRRHAAEIEDLLETVYRAFPPGAPKMSAETTASETEIVHREASERLHDAFWEDAMRRHLH
jgi:hypothetical protein